MEVEKIRNLSDDELKVEERKTGEQLFRLRFQMKLGQTEGVKKLRELRRDIARIKTIARERELHVHGAEHKLESSAPAKTVRRKSAKPAHRKAAKKTAARKSSGRTTAKKKTSGGRTTKRAAARTGKVKKG
jgi:large subunit ribosomal protein L29